MLLMPTLFVFSVAAVASILPLARSRTEKGLFSSESTILLVLTLLLPVVATTMVFIIRFLSGTSDRVHQMREPWRWDDETIQEQVASLRNTVQLLDEGNRESIIGDIKHRISETATEEFLAELKVQVRDADYRKSIADRSESSLKRIYLEIDALGRRGTLNLSIGVIMALIGVTLLGYIVLNGTKELSSSYSSLATHFFPRFTVVILIELFSFFFLRLYKSSLDEIKYFQNEATNLEMRFTALDAVLHFGDKPLRAKVIDSLLQTDRNPMLPTGLSTRELESMKQLDMKMRFTPEHIVDLLRASRSEITMGCNGAGAPYVLAVEELSCPAA
ncbi:MAG: hypothetical protein R3B84_00460 [Zavarzinella sp.]